MLKVQNPKKHTTQIRACFRNIQGSKIASPATEQSLHTFQVLLGCFVVLLCLDMQVEECTYFSTVFGRYLT
jgi:hypothetical protein